MTLEHQLRELCAYYEWSSPPNMAAADVLQASADAVKHGALSDRTAKALVDVWGAFVGVNANCGAEPAYMTIASTEDEIHRGILSDFRLMIARENNTEKKLHLTRLLEKQIAIFAQGMS
jgi:hypothetical protein